MCISERALLLASKHGTATNGFLVGSFVSELGLKTIIFMHFDAVVGQANLKH